MRYAICAIFAFTVSSTTIRAQDVAVTVVSMLASDRHKEINPILVQVADEIRKRDPSLTGWKIERQTSKTLKLNQKESFPLYSDINAEISVAHCDDTEKPFRLTVRAPHAGEITYTTKAAKYFPVWTRYQTEKDKERLIFAVMVKPAPVKEEKKP